MSAELITAITSFSRDEAFRITKELLEAGGGPEDILDASRSAMQTIGDLFEAGAEIDVYVMQSVLGLLDMGYEVFLLEDCIFTSTK